MSKVQRAETEYEVRGYSPHDRDGFLSLYESVWGNAKERPWFDWRFEENPYSDGVEMVVTDHGGELVGVEPLLVLPLATDEGRIVARQPVDWIVHPDHRRRGLFTRMTEELLSTSADRTSLLFNFPSAVLRPGLQKFDWVELGSVPTRYRVHNLTRFVPEKKGVQNATASMTARAGSPALRRCLSAIDHVRSPSSDYEIERVEGTAVSAIQSVYQDTRPSKIHVPREEAFIRWRFSNPRWTTTTYVAFDEDSPAATLVAATERVGESVITRILDVQPMETDPDRRDAVEAALLAVLADHQSADVLEASATPFPRVFRRHGFLSDASFPFERVSTPTTHAVRSLQAERDAVPDGGRASPLGCDVLDRDNWLLSLADRDVA